jgi:hypothetical protein
MRACSETAGFSLYLVNIPLTSVQLSSITQTILYFIYITYIRPYIALFRLRCLRTYASTTGVAAPAVL